MGIYTPEWQTNNILSNAGSQYKLLWLFAIFWNVITWAAIILGGENILKAFEESPVFYFFILFPFIGLFMIYQAVNETLAWKKFGKTPLTMTPFPGQLGGVVGAYVDLPIPYDAEHEAKVSLSCMHYYWEKRGSESESTSEAIWQDNISVRTTPSASGSRIHFEFQPPGDLPESELERKDHHGWDVQISMPLEGSDFERKFTIPVIKASELVIASSARYARPSVKKISQSEESTDSLIPQISSFSGGARFHYPQFRNKGLGVGLIIAGMLISVFLLFMRQGFADFLPVTSMIFFGFAELIVVAMLIGGLYLISNSLTVDVDSAGVNIRHKMPGFSFGGEIERSSIADFVAEKSASSSDGKSIRVWYSLKLIQKDGKETSVGDTLEGYSYAQGIRQQMIENLGAEWSSSKYPVNQKSLKNSWLPLIVKVIRKIISLVLPVAIIYDFRELFFSLFQMVTSIL